MLEFTLDQKVNFYMQLTYLTLITTVKQENKISYQLTVPDLANLTVNCTNLASGKQNLANAKQKWFKERLLQNKHVPFPSQMKEQLNV